VSGANEAGDTVAESIISKLIEGKDDSAAYRTHIRSLIENNFFYLVMTIDGCSMSVTGNGQDAKEWRMFALLALEKILAARKTDDEEDIEYEAKKGDDAKTGYA